MQNISPSPSPAPPSSLHRYFPTPHHLSLFTSSKTHHETQQLHAFSVKTSLFHHPSFPSRLISLYTSPPINNLPYAISIFNTISNPPLILFNMLIKCYVENHFAHDAIMLFYDMIREVLPDNFTFPCVIKGCWRLRAVKEGEQIHGLVVKLGFGEDKFVQSSLLALYAKSNKMGYARKLFDKMPERDRDLVSWNCLIDGYGRCGEVEVALRLFEEMPERDSFSWTALLDGFSRAGETEKAREIFDKMQIKSLVSWNAMINGYMKSGDYVSARKLFNRMPMRNLITWNVMIGGYELNVQFKDAFKMFLKMLEEEVRPNGATLVSVLSAASRSAVLSKGRWLHSYIVKNGIQLDGVIGTTLIEMYSKCGSIENALSVFRAIPRKKLGHWTAVIVGLGMHGMADQAHKLFSEMCQTGVKPHAITFVGVLNACSHAGVVEDARRYFKLMVDEYRIKPTVEHYGCLVDVLCRTGNLEEAKNVIDNMPMRPNKVIWMSLLSSARIYAKTDIGEYAAQHLMEMAPETIGCYVLLSNMYAAAGKWDKVSQVRQMMKKRGLKKGPGCSLIEHRGVLHRFIVGDESHPQKKEIYSKLREMTERLKLAGHVPDTTQVVLCIEGEEKKEAELETHSERLAVAFGLINMETRGPIRIVKNLRICSDCHAVIKLLSQIYDREIIVRDNSRFHHFQNGSCSCKDFW